MSHADTQKVLTKINTINRWVVVFVVLAFVGYGVVILITTTQLGQHRLALQKNSTMRADIANAQTTHSDLVLQITNPQKEVVVAINEAGEEVLEDSISTQRPNKNVHFIAINSSGPVVAYGVGE